MQTLLMRTPEDLAAARELLFQYEGSSFYMSRDGLEQEYLGHRVPKSLEAEWMRELTEQRMRSVGHAVNVVNQGGTIRFLDDQAGGLADLSPWNRFHLLRRT